MPRLGKPLFITILLFQVTIEDFSQIREIRIAKPKVAVQIINQPGAEAIARRESLAEFFLVLQFAVLYCRVAEDKQARKKDELQFLADLDHGVDLPPAGFGRNIV